MCGSLNRVKTAIGAVVSRLPILFQALCHILVKMQKVTGIEHPSCNSISIDRF
jgi:hypothetical protein